MVTFKLNLKFIKCSSKLCSSNGNLRNFYNGLDVEEGNCQVKL